MTKFKRMKTLLSFLIGSLLLVSCSESGKRVPKKEGIVTVFVAKATVLENNTKTLVYLNKNEFSMMNVNDTVWVDLDTHNIDDTCRTAMKVVVDEIMSNGYLLSK